MQVSPSLAEFMERLDEGPRGSGDAIAAITKCADESGRLLDLQQMNLTNEDLELIAPKLAAISSHVKELNLFMNEITVLPALINILSGLEILLVGCNPLESISEDLLPGLPKLTVLDVGFSEILTQLPDSFHKSVELRILKAGNGRLSSLPASLFKCIKLEELYLYGNCLKDIGEELQCLENLRILNLGRNQIVKLPLGLGKLTALEILHVYENCLSSLPPGVRSLGKLQTLNAQSNEALPIPPRDVRCLADAKATAAFLASGNVN